MDEKNETPATNTLLNNPLFMPPGSVRAIIGLILVCGTVYAWLTNPDNVPVGLITLTTAVATFYYGTKK
ncbi:MAG: hypothetical protein J7K40_13855 [candidate division Zixibacteria bacterium]|nr:hypothetical protein [candidate division Zixibacteria bacterium]